ncbi:MerR family transcriptional regulator [Paenibacillus polymyxa]|uniref:MerR family transcriptional regulator n=1 Tax=Paenibacillus polymyxa TaxID=1406 RepID=A0ABX2ZCM6_PAEPO|nr:MerR family transcriptional regulator [Paenibacillus polymyxa]ODA09230.1 MerR family transcriptional regulator [Paenibacillus polymyxa]
MSTIFLIGEISKLFQIDIRTLRYYDSIHLFEPASVDEATGYRYYSIDQFERLNTILYLKALNIPLKEIKQFLDDRDVDHILALLKEQKRRTEEKILEFKQIQQRINKRIQQIEDVSKVEELFKIRETQLPERMIVMLKQTIGKSDNLEMSIRMLEKNSNMKSTIFLGQVGLAISITNLRQRKFDEYDAIFLFVEPDKHQYSEAAKKSLPQQKYLTIRFIGTHADASIYYKKLLKHAHEKGYALADDALEITYIDYGLTQDVSKFVTEIQIPVNDC